MYRDVIKTMLSLYYFVPQKDRGKDIHEFIRQVRGDRQLSRIGFWAYFVSRWVHESGVVFLNYDQLLRDTEFCLDEIGNCIHEKPLMKRPLLPQKPDSLLSRRLGYIFSRNPVSTSILSFENREYNSSSFTDEDKLFIESEINRIDPDLNNFLSRFKS